MADGTYTTTKGTGTGHGGIAGITTKAAKAGKGKAKTKAKTKAKAKAKAKAKEARSLALCEQAAALVRAGISYRQRRRTDPHWLDELVGSAWLILHDRGERAERRKKRQRAAAKSEEAPKKKPGVVAEVTKVLRNALRDRRRLDARHAAGVTGRGEEVAWESVGEGFAQALVVVDPSTPEACAIASQTGAARIARATPRERRAVQVLFAAAAAGGAT